MKIDSILIYLPERLSKALIKSNTDSITEIRLRASSPASITKNGKNIALDENGNYVSPDKGLVLSPDEVSSCVNALCRYSRYSFEEAIKNGFIPLEGGGRAGVCGKAVSFEGKINTIYEITSINIRLNSFIPNIAANTAALMKDFPVGVLVFSPPGMGKTTYLKSLIYLLSMGKYSNAYRVGVVDERFELGEGIPKTGFCDIISGCPKNIGIELLTRTMSPEIIVCDEILDFEKDAVLNSCNSGVSFICSVHGSSIEGIKKRGFVNSLLESNIFQYAVGIEKAGREYKYTVEKLEF